MKAIMCRDFGPDGIVVADVPAPDPGPGELRLRMRMAAISFADRLIADGRYQSRPPFPFVLGSEGIGVVDAVGAGIAPSWLDRKVMAYGFQPGPLRHRAVIGTWAQHAIVAIGDIVEQPHDMDDTFAVAFRTSYETAYYALRASGLRAGEKLLVLGAGGATGIAAVEIGKALGATVAGSAGSCEKRALAVARGASVAIDSAARDWKEQARAASDGKGFDVVFDPVGGPLTEAALRSLAFRGRLLVVGFASGDIPDLPANLLIMKGVAVIGINQMMFRDLDPNESAKGIADLLLMHSQGRFAASTLSARLTLIDAADAVRKPDSFTRDPGRMVIDMSL